MRSICQSPASVRTAEIRRLLIARSIVNFETPVAFAAIPSDAYIPLHPRLRDVPGTVSRHG
jgi:hypothetical protein